MRAWLAGCPAAVAGSQTASLSKGQAKMQQQQQQSKMYTRGALQALAGKNKKRRTYNSYLHISPGE
jgi:hypothetical protein